MKNDPFLEITSILRDLDVNHEFSELLSNDKLISELKENEFKKFQNTLDKLSTFGDLKSPIEKLKLFIKKAKSGEITYDDLKNSIQKTAKIEVEEMIHIYLIAENFYNQQKYDEAIEVSTFLSSLNPEISLFWKMTGLSYSKLGNEQAALAPYLLASMKNSLSIDNHLSALDCLGKLGLSQQALNYYSVAKEVLSDAQKFDDITKLDSKISTL
jgi:tetratricopeptide (TPR) repeat protein